MVATKEKNGVILEEIMEGHFYATDPHWHFGLEDEKERQFGVYFEITDMEEATGEKEFKDYPFVLSAGIIADKCHKSFSEIEKSSKLSLIYDCHSYMGSVPIDHTLINGINGGIEEIKKLFTTDETMVKKSNPKWGAIAAQQGKGIEFEYLQFKTYEAAIKLMNFLVKERVGVLGMMIGFILDRPINLMGDSGWGNMNTMVYGKNYKSKEK